MDITQLENVLKSYPAYRLKQAQSAIFEQLIDSWSQASSLPEELRERLEKECPLTIKAKIEQSKNKKTVKAVIYLEDNQAVETVLMRHAGGRRTVCVSCQIGCPLACAFCATGQMGFKRNLSAGEIVEQVLFFSRFLQKKQQRVSNVVFMGMGEPFLNYDEVLSAIRQLNDPKKLGIGSRHISVSTVGIIEGIKKLATEPLQINLAISLHAPSDILRSQLMPINKKYPLIKVLAATADYFEKTRRRVAIEYLMLENVNDSPDQAQALAELLKKYLAGSFFVNLIAYNYTGKYQPTRPDKIKKFEGVLRKAGLDVVQRYRFGDDIKGACGQLAQARAKLL